MHKILFYGVLSILTLSVGCAAPKYNYQGVTKNISKPLIGEVSEAYIGDKILVEGQYTEKEAYYVPEEKNKSNHTIIPKGYYLKTGEDAKGSYYLPVNSIPEGAILPHNQGIRSILVTKKNDFCLVDFYSYRYCHFKDIGHTATVNVVGNSSFQRTLIYSGKVGNKVNIGYREYSSNIARPAFNNDVEYDLNESRQIGYKGALLEIIDANNQRIQYKVLKGFSSVE